MATQETTSAVAEQPLSETPFFETKDKRKSPCTINWEKEYFTITCGGKELYEVHWKTVAAVNVQPKMFTSTMVIFDCKPNETKQAMLIKLWIPNLAMLETIKQQLVINQKKSVTGHGVLWSNLYRSSMLPYFHRYLNQFWQSLSFGIEVTLILVTMFIILDLCGMHEPGISSEEFPEEAEHIIRSSETLEDLQTGMYDAVLKLSHTDREIVNKRWEKYGWKHTFTSRDEISKHPRKAVRELFDNDYLAFPIRWLMRKSRKSFRWSKNIGFPFLMSNPQYLLLAPVVFPFVLLFSAFMLWVFIFGLVIYGIKHFTVMLLSLKIIHIAKHFVFHAKSFYSTVKNSLRIVTDCMRFLNRFAKRFLGRFRL